MQISVYEKKYIQLISDHLKVSPDQIFLYWKGRIALYAILKSLGIQHGDDIILPGFTCVVVPNAIKYLDARPVYVDINIDTFNPDFESIKKAVTANTKVIIVQNTFGLSTDVDKISQWASMKGIYTIEDCTHGFGGTYNGKPNGSFCDAAFYSTQWNKPFSTGIGGFALVNNKKLIQNLKDVNEDLVKPGKLEELQLNLLNLFYQSILNEKTYWIFRRIYRYLSKLNLVLGSSQGNELRKPVLHDNYFKSGSSIQSKLGINKLTSINGLIEKRRKNAILYSDFLASRGKVHVKSEFFPNHSFLKYPILVKDRKLFNKLAEKAKIPLGDWFISPLHPVTDNFKNWDLVLNDLPNVRKIYKQILNLPTENDNPERVLNFLEKNLKLII